MNEIFTELSMKGCEEKAEECLKKFQKEINSLKRGIIDVREKYLDDILTLGKRQEMQDDSELFELRAEIKLASMEAGLNRSSELKSY